MDNLELFKLCTKNEKCNKFKIFFEPHYFTTKDEFILYENSEKAVKKLVEKDFGVDNEGNSFFNHAKRVQEILENKEIAEKCEYIEYTKVTKSYAFGWVFDGCDRSYFTIIGIE